MTSATSAIVRDLVIEELAAGEAGLRARVADLTRDVVVYRSLAIEAIHVLYDEKRASERLRSRYHQLLDEYRRLRAQIRRAA